MFFFVLIEGEATLQIYDLKSAICNRGTAVSLSRRREEKSFKFILPFSTLFYFSINKIFSLSLFVAMQSREEIEKCIFIEML